jgi:flagellin-like hook-associated protein FlgL
MGVSSYSSAQTGDVSQMMTANRTTTVANATYSYDSQTGGGSVGASGQSVTISGQKSVYTAGTGAVPADTKRAAAASAYKLALTAIDQYLKDASVSGINLLNGDSLIATFNEKGTSSTVQLTNSAGTAASYGSAGLGLTNATGAQDYANNFAVNVDTADAAGNPLTGLQAAINKLTAAQTTIQLGVAQVGQFQSTIQNRSDFNSSIISLLNDSANNLTAADMTQVSTMTAALQVQQSFAQAILSATKQSDQSMLQLLR